MKVGWRSVGSDERVGRRREGSKSLASKHYDWSGGRATQLVTCRLRGTLTMQNGCFQRDAGEAETQRETTGKCVQRQARGNANGAVRGCS